MKIRKYQTFFESKQDIESICREYNITNYTINNDGTIDVEGSVDLSSRKLTKLPLKFRNVGDFDCSRNHLITLEGCPQSVKGDFDCGVNDINNLEYCPQHIGGYFDCSYNNILSLKGCPKNITGNFYCSKNKLKTLEGGPTSVSGNYIAISTGLTSLKGSPKFVGGDFNIYDNNVTTLQFGPKFVRESFICNNNQIIDFRGFPDLHEGTINFTNNPVSKILDKFPNRLKVKAIYWINEFDVIDNNGNVIEDRLDDVREQLNI